MICWGHRRRRGDTDKTDEEKAQELEDEFDEDYYRILIYKQ
jgi:hypothetical protein